MSEIPDNLMYTASHEWVMDLGNGTFRVGITDHAQKELTDLVYVELPDSDAEFESSNSMAVVESVKAASDIYAPLNGKVIETNSSLEDNPELINESPYELGWLLVLASTDNTDNLLTPEKYKESIG
tara:strand:- start:16960 stop:17337 length:378 start_codon:yes stop_codon:yes gene_type:complete